MLPNGTAAIKLRFALGSTKVQASFTGTNAYAASDSDQQTLSVSGVLPTKTTLVSTPAGNIGVLTGTVQTTGVAPGNFEFYDFSRTYSLGVVPLSPTTLSEHLTLKPLPTSRHLPAVADFNNDGIPDLAQASLELGVSIRLGNGDGTFQEPINYPAGGQCCVLVTGDLNHDGNIDISVNGDAVLLGRGDGTFNTPIYGLLTRNVVSALVADFNHDGIQDIAIGTRDGDTLVRTLLISFGNGDGTFQNPLPVTIPSDFTGGFTAGDFNGDGYPDLAVCVNWEVRILTGNGKGSFSIGNIGVHSPTDSVAAADLDGDHPIDLLVGSADGVFLFPGKGDGDFQAAQQLNSNVGILQVAVNDLNNDGLPDVVYATAVDGIPESIETFLNKGSNTLQAGGASGGA